MPYTRSQGDITTMLGVVLVWGWVRICAMPLRHGESTHVLTPLAGHTHGEVADFREGHEVLGCSLPRDQPADQALPLEGFSGFSGFFGPF